MNMKARRLGFLLATFVLLHITAALTEESDLEDFHSRPKRVAIIGGGIGGTSASFYLKQRLQEGVEIFLYERNDYLGGRVNDISIEGINLEIGGSIYHECNREFATFVKDLGLHSEAPLEGIFGVWNGKDFVLRESEWKLVTLAKMLYRYGTAPLKVRTLAESIKDKFINLYALLENRTFDRVIDVFNTVGLGDLTSTFTNSSLLANGIDELFIREMVAGITRINYGQDVTLHALAGYVSLIGSGDGLYAVKGGNKQVAERLAQRAQAIVQKNTHVIAIDRKVSPSGLEYTIRSKHNAAGTSEVEETVDAVIIAAPLEFANIRLAFLEKEKSQQPLTNVVPDRPYQRTCVTVVIGQLNPGFFGLGKDDSIPDLVLTMENSAIPFSSIAAKRRLPGQSGAVYKIFSRKPLSDSFLDSLFVKRTGQAFRHEWNAYPVLSPTDSPASKWPQIKLDDRVFYVNALESAVSTIETESIASKNVVNLLLASWLE